MTDPNHSRHDRSARRRATAPSRRRLLLGAATVAGATVAGCLGDDGGDEPPAEPIALTDGLACDVCGMVIEETFGPAGQIFYADGKPEDRDGPARFDSVAELVVSLAEREQTGWEPRGVFVTDYSRVEYDVVEQGGGQYVENPVDADTFADAADCHYVVGSDVEGAMGPELHPFGERADAEDFADEYGGSVKAWDELSPADGAR